MVRDDGIFFLDIIHCPVFIYLKSRCPRRFGSIDWAQLNRLLSEDGGRVVSETLTLSPEIGTSSLDWIQMSRFFTRGRKQSRLRSVNPISRDRDYLYLLGQTQ
jgi:hypothetical protein